MKGKVQWQSRDKVVSWESKEKLEWEMESIVNKNRDRK